MNKTRRRQGPHRRTTFDIEAALHKRMQMVALEEDVNMVDLVEQGVRNLLDTLDDPSHDWAYHVAFEAGRRAAFAEAQEAVRVLAEEAQPTVAVTPSEPVVPAPVRLLPTRPPTLHTQGQS